MRQLCWKIFSKRIYLWYIDVFWMANNCNFLLITYVKNWLIRNFKMRQAHFDNGITFAIDITLYILCVRMYNGCLIDCLGSKKF